MNPHRRFPAQAEILYALEIVGLICGAFYILSNIAEFFSRIHTLVAIVISAILFAYAIGPIIGRLQTVMSRPLAIVCAYVGIVAIMISVMAFVVPRSVASVQGLSLELPQLAHNYRLQAGAVPGMDRLPAQLREQILRAPEGIANSVGQFGSRANGSLVSFAFSAFWVVAFVVIVPILAIYLLLETHAVWRWTIGLLPSDYRLPIARVVREIDLMLSAFIRGQLLVAAIVGVLMTLLLLALHVKYAPLIGLAAGLFDLVPYVGAIAGWIPAVTIALLTNGLASAAFVTIGIVVINQLEGNVLIPNIVSKNVNLSPLAVILALFLGGELFGTLGLVITVPAIAILRIVGEKVAEKVNEENSVQ